MRTQNYFRRIPTYVITVPKRYRRTDRRTDRRTTYDLITALCVASHGKNLQCDLCCQQTIHNDTVTLAVCTNLTWFHWRLAMYATHDGTAEAANNDSCTHHLQWSVCMPEADVWRCTVNFNIHGCYMYWRQTLVLQYLPKYDTKVNQLSSVLPASNNSVFHAWSFNEAVCREVPSALPEILLQSPVRYILEWPASGCRRCTIRQCVQESTGQDVGRCEHLRLSLSAHYSSSIK